MPSPINPDELSAAGPIALVGSGEFLPQMVEVDRLLLTGRPARVAFLPTAAGEEGTASFGRWLSLGTAHYRSMEVEAVPVPVANRNDANNPDLAALISGVGLIYLSGGNPGYLARTLNGTLVWQAIVDAWAAGAALAGCSAGAMAISAEAPGVRGSAISSEPGLALVAHLAVLPHFDRMAQWGPKFMRRATAPRQPGVTVVGIDEDTALVGGPQQWTVMGRQHVTVFSADGPVVYASGDELTLAP